MDSRFFPLSHNTTIFITHLHRGFPGSCPSPTPQIWQKICQQLNESTWRLQRFQETPTLGSFTFSRIGFSPGHFLLFCCFTLGLFSNPGTNSTYHMGFFIVWSGLVRFGLYNLTHQDLVTCHRLITRNMTRQACISSLSTLLVSFSLMGFMLYTFSKLFSTFTIFHKQAGPANKYSGNWQSSTL